MSKIILGSYMFRYPLGGMLSWALQYLIGFRDLGHDVYFVEKANYPNACFDIQRREMSDDCSSGLQLVSAIFREHDLADRWCFVDFHGNYFGLNKDDIESVFRSADLFVDGGNHGAWAEEAQMCSRRVLIDGEPGFTQMRWENMTSKNRPTPEYDYHFTNGYLIGDESCSAPLASCQWTPVFNPVISNWYDVPPAPGGSPYTTVMNWQSHDVVEFGGRRYGQKDVEFARFLDLPLHVEPSMEVAVAGKNVPHADLRQSGWSVRHARDVTESIATYRNYIESSRGEFSVCKHVFVATHSGWFSDRSAAYLSAGRPVVLQDTGFSNVLPVGEGLFAPTNVEEAAAAIDSIESDYKRHAASAKEIASEYLEASKVLGRMLQQVGL